MAEINKKGILLTLGLSFLALSVLTLSIIMFHNIQESEEITSKLAIFDRLYELDNSIQDSLSDIFIYGSGINLTVDGSGVIFRQMVANPKGVSYNRTMKSFKGFIETNFRNIVNISNMPNKINLEVLPLDMEYVYNITEGSVLLLPTSLPDYYEINFTVTGANITAPTNCGVSTGSFVWNIYSEDDEGNSYSCLNNVDPSIETISTIPTTAGDEVRVKIYGSGKLFVNSSVGFEPYAAIKAGVSVSGITITYPKEIISINFNDFGINKTSTVTLY